MDLGATGNPFFTIVIPTYNRANLLPGTMRSIREQQYGSYEVIIVDDGSKDNTQEVVKPFLNDRIRYIRIPNSERGAARNVGIQNARGNYITFLDSDDQLYPCYLLNAAETLEKLNRPEFFHLAYEIKDESGNVLQKVDQLKSDDVNMFIKGNPLSCLGVFVRKDITTRFRFIEDRRLSGSEDWELWIRLAANYGIKTDNRISAALISHSGRSVLNYKEEDLLLRKLCSLDFAFKDPKVAEVFSASRNRIESYCDSYISLHLALINRRAAAIKYLAKSLLSYPQFVVERRFFSIIKHLFLIH